MKNTMTITEIIEAIGRDEIKIELSGHAIRCTKEALLEKLNHDIEYSKGSNDGNWTYDNPAIPPAVTDARMREYCKNRLTREINQGEAFPYDEDKQCQYCGIRLNPVLTGDKLQFREYYDHARNDFVMFPPDYTCEYAKAKPNKGEITIASRLIITNFFVAIEDAPDGKKYDNKYSLCTRAGREQITKYKVTQNVAYGQMGNTSIGIYINKVKDSIIIGPSYHPAEHGKYETDQEYYKAVKKPPFPGYKKVGEVTLTVWRWEATDRKTLGPENYRKLKKLAKDRDMDVIELNVPHGTWEFEHFYDLPTNDTDDDSIYATLKLKQ